MSRSARHVRLFALLAGVCSLALPATAQLGVLSEQKISDTMGGLAGGPLRNGDEFGYSAASLGDLDGDGITDLAVGARNDNDGGIDRGAVWILFMNTDGTVGSSQKISNLSGGFTGVLDDLDNLGSALAALGDLDGDAIEDLAVGARFDDDGGLNRGAVWILFLNADGTVKSHQKISNIEGGFAGVLDDSDQFGMSLASPGDLDGDGNPDLAVGANLDDDGGVNEGAVWILFLDADGTVKSHQKISSTAGGFGGLLDSADQFGTSLAALEDLDGDAVVDLAVGAVGDDDGGNLRGAVWILFLDTNGTVQAEQKISATAGGFSGDLSDSDLFGSSLASFDDLDGNGTPDLAVGAITDDDGGADQGATWLLFLDPDGTVGSEQKISETAGGFGGVLDSFDNFGISGTSLGDLDGDGTPDLAVGAHRDDDGGSSAGAIWVLFLGNDTIPPVITCPGDLLQEGTSPSGAVGTFSVTATDDVDPMPTLVCVPASGSTFPLGTTTVACTATDDSGNSSMCSFDVTVADTTDPMVTCPGNITAEGTSPAGRVITFSPTASDACDATPTIVSVPASGSTFALGTTAVTVTATDDSGNSSLCMFDVTVQDTTDPMITCPGNITAEGTSPAGRVITFSPTASDACDSTPSIVSVPPSGSTFALGTTMVDVTATDASGNSSMCSFSVTVQDTTPPVLTCPGDMKVRAPKGAHAVPVTYSADASDLCDAAPELVYVPPSGSLFPPGTTTVTVTATDDAGNSSACSFQVTVGPMRRLNGTPGLVVLNLPALLVAGASPAAAPGAEAEVEFSYPPGEPILMFEVAGARVELTDGSETIELYAPDRAATGVVLESGPTMSVYADLSVLFPASTSETLFRLTPRLLSDDFLFDGLRFHGGARLRNGSDVNEIVFVSAGTPVAGEDWQAWVDTSAQPAASVSLVVVSVRALEGKASPFGEILVGKALFTSLVPSSGGTDVHSMPIPLAALGRSFSLQAAILGQQGMVLTNAIDLVIGP